MSHNFREKKEIGVQARSKNCLSMPLTARLEASNGGIGRCTTRGDLLLPEFVCIVGKLPCTVWSKRTNLDSLLSNHAECEELVYSDEQTGDNS